MSISGQEFQTLWELGQIRADRITYESKKPYDARRKIYLTSDDERRIGQLWDPTPAKLRKKRRLYFHPFRFLVYMKLLEVLDLHWEKDPEDNGWFMCRFEPSNGQDWNTVSETADHYNGIADLAILLEPIYWWWMTSVRRSRSLTSSNWSENLKHYESKVFPIIERLPLESFESIHDKLTWMAHGLDSNDDLYLILRTASWDFRKKLKGNVSGSLYLRHMAEIIRHACKEIHNVRLSEEDCVVGFWREGMRERMYGSEHPLDLPKRYQKNILKGAGLDSSVQVRWYVEGETEVGAIKEGCGNDTLTSDIEIVNLKGAINKKGGNELLLSLLLADRDAERFSFITLDDDDEKNIKAIKVLAKKQDLFVGWIHKSEKDFEFGNFDLGELKEVAIRMDASLGRDTRAQIEHADSSHVDSGKEFSKWYERVSIAPPMKGDLWGRHLMRYAMEYPERNSTGKERPLITAIRNALRSKLVNYQSQRRTYYVNPDNLQVEEIQDVSETEAG